MLKWLLIPVLLLAAKGGDPVQAQSFGPRRTLGNVEHPDLVEASGLVKSRRHDDLLWTHNDSGDSARVFALRTDGSHAGFVCLPEIKAVDWEDIAMGPGPIEGKDYLFIGDIGDNHSRRASIQVHRFAEPEEREHPEGTFIRDVDTFRFAYPDGPRDAETLIADPLTGDLFIISKERDGARVYRAPYPQRKECTDTLTYETTLNHSFITAGDLSRDGRWLIIKNYVKVFIYRRNPDGRFFDPDTAFTIHYIPEPQGEAVAWDRNRMAFFTVSEVRGGVPAVLYSYSFYGEHPCFSPSEPFSAVKIKRRQEPE